jgi:hypothetical protein
MARQKFMIGSGGDNGEHIRGDKGWPYSIYLQDDNIGGCDKVLCHGIQNLDDAKHLLELCNGSWQPTLASHMQLFARV